MPIIVGYFPIGMAFGVYAVTAGLDWYWPVLIGLIQYSEAAQFFLVALLAENTAPPVILGTLLVLNMRHVFYGLPLLDALPTRPIQRFLAIFWLTDEVYSVLTSRPADQRPPFIGLDFGPTPPGTPVVTRRHGRRYPFNPGYQPGLLTHRIICDPRH